MNEEHSPIKLFSHKKLKTGIDWKKCIICQNIHHNDYGDIDEPIITVADQISAIVKAAEIRKDTVHNRMKQELSNLNKLHSRPVVCHTTCFRDYINEEFVLLSDNAYSHRPVRQLTSFDWINKCMFCGNKKYKKEWKLIQVLTYDAEDKIRYAAQIRNDKDIQHKLSNTDLIAIEAHYHKSCHATFTSKANLEHYLKPKETDIQNDQYDIAFASLVNDIYDDIMQNGRVFDMSILLEMFKSKFSDNKLVMNYRTEKLKHRLEKYFGSDITIQKQVAASKPNLVHSSRINVADAVLVASRLKSEIHSIKESTDILQTNGDTQNDSIVLHQAVSLLRNEMDGIVEPETYPTPDDISLESSKRFVPSTLFSTIMWLIDKTAFEQGLTGENQVTSIEKTRRCLAICETIIYSSRRIITPLQFGLAAQMHAEYGKKGIIENLHSHGFSCSYDELRRFTTASAQDEISQIKTGNHIPTGLLSRRSGGGFIQEADDNIKVNSGTIDGKDTFHSLARVVFQTYVKKANHSRKIKKIKQGSRSLTKNDITVSRMTRVLPFNKPPQRAQPERKPKALELFDACKKSTPVMQDITWVLLRMLHRGLFALDSMQDQKVPFWTGFNATSGPQSSCATAVYLPVIQACPSDMATVYTCMKQCQDMTTSLGQKTPVQTFDQQLYAVAQQVRWCTPEIKTVTRLGGFHTVCTFIASIGRIWGDAGLSDLLTTVYAGNSVDMMLSGKQFHRAVRGLTLCYEALMHLKINMFYQWCSCAPVEHDKLIVISHHVMDTYEDYLSNDLERIELSTAALMEDLNLDFCDLFSRFEQMGHDTSPTFQFWDMFLHAAEILLSAIRADREGKWNLHLQAMYKMIPYFFATNRQNYARWTPIYLFDMLQLPDDVQEAFDQGNFSLSLGSGRFNAVWSDMAAESTVIKDCKGDGGLIRLTRKEPALVRWFLTRHVMGVYASDMRKRSGSDKGSTMKEVPHEQCQQSFMKRDELHVQKMITTMKQDMTNPFDCESHPKCLIHIRSGMHASAEVQSSLLGVIHQGETKFESFVSLRLVETETTSFYSPIPRNLIKNLL